MILPIGVIPVLYLDRARFKDEVAALKDDLNHTVAQQQVTEWMAAFASASSISLVINSKPGASVASRIVGVLWPNRIETGHRKTNPWLVDGDLTAYNWFSGPMQQHVALRNGSGYRWTTSGFGTERINLSWCLTHADMPDFSQLQRLNESVTVWAPTSEESTGSEVITLHVVYDGEPYKITATCSENPSTIFRVEGTKMVMVLDVEQNPSDRSGSMLKNDGVWPKCPQLFGIGATSPRVQTQEPIAT